MERLRVEFCGYVYEMQEAIDMSHRVFVNAFVLQAKDVATYGRAAKELLNRESNSVKKAVSS